MPVRLRADERGVSAIEYSLLVALIGLGMVASVQAAGSGLAASLDAVEAAFVDAIGAGEPGEGKPGKAKPPKKKPK